MFGTPPKLLSGPAASILASGGIDDVRLFGRPPKVVQTQVVLDPRIDPLFPKPPKVVRQDQVMSGTDDGDDRSVISTGLQEDPPFTMLTREDVESTQAPLPRPQVGLRGNTWATEPPNPRHRKVRTKAHTGANDAGRGDGVWGGTDGDGGRGGRGGGGVGGFGGESRC